MLNIFFKGIFGHFLLRAIVIQAAAGVLLLAFLFLFFDRTINELAAEQGHTFANSTLAATSDAILSEDYAAIVDYSLSVMKGTPNILFIAFSKRNGEELVVRDKHWELKYKSQLYYLKGFEDRYADTYPHSMEYEGYAGLAFTDNFKYSQPIYLADKEWGVLTISFSTETFKSSIRAFYHIVVSITFGSTILSLLLFYLSSGRIRNEIQSFGTVAKKLSEGLLDSKAEESAIGEIGDLATAVNKMSDSLKAKSRRIAQLVNIVEQTNDAFVLLDDSRHIIFANDALKKFTGCSSSHFIGMHLDEFASENYLGLPEFLPDLDFAVAPHQVPASHDVVLVRNDGVQFNLEARFEFVKNEKEKSGNFLIVLSDITERKHAEQQLRIAAIAFESQVGMLVTDSNGLILQVNRAFTTITGYADTDVLGKNPRVLGSGRHDAEFFSAMYQNIENIGSWEGEIWNKRKNGEEYPLRLVITAVKNSTGNLMNYVASFTDITLSKSAADQIEQLAFYDPLTGLPNRRLLQDRLQHALASSGRGGKEGAVLFIDLDNFKKLNDTLGHDTGDMLLEQVADRLASCVRKGDTVARLGGDEFVVMLEDLSENTLEAAEQTEFVGNKILNTLNQPYLLGKFPYQSTPSIGATLFKNSKSMEELLKQADIAMYQAKRAGRNLLRFYDPEMQDNINTRAALEDDLRIALENRQFHLYYQIQVDNARNPVGAEVLIRWQHPVRGLISPAQFIPLAEETGQIRAIGQWVLASACAQLKKWEQSALTSSLALSVNVSAKQFHQADLVAQVRSAVHQNGINPALLTLELTETMLVSNIEDTIRVMNELNEIGVGISLDDFGTGYSSLQYLKRLPLHQLKIDQSFVRDIATNNSDKAIVSTIILMAQSLNLDVIAEGVETEGQKQILNNTGCSHFQGFLFSKPVPIDQFENLLKHPSLFLA